jgi:hypothetical protein
MYKPIITDEAQQWLVGRMDQLLNKINRQPCQYELSFIEMIEKIKVALDEAEFIAPPKVPRQKQIAVKMKHGCEDHPTYKAARRPRTGCESCWQAFRSYHPERYEQARRDFERKEFKTQNG